MRYRYKYEGPVLVNSNVVTLQWKGEVESNNETLAEYYMKKEFLKKNTQFDRKARVYLPKKIIKMEAVL